MSVLIVIPHRACICNTIALSVSISASLALAFSTRVIYCRYVLQARIILILLKQNLKHWKESRAS